MKLSDLMEGALEELEKFEKRDRCKVWMSTWCRKADDVCYACLGGIWGLKQAGIDPDNPSADRMHTLEIDKNKAIRRQERALNEVRLGSLKYANWVLNSEETKLPSSCPIADYEQSPQRFKTDLRAAIKLVRNAGY